MPLRTRHAALLAASSAAFLAALLLAAPARAEDGKPPQAGMDKPPQAGMGNPPEAGAGKPPQAGMDKPPLKAVVFDVEPVSLPSTPAMREKVAAVTALLRKLVADRGYAIVDTAPLAKKIADNTPLSQCNGCDQRIAQALGADVEIATAMQGVTAATYSLSGSVKDVATDRVLRQGVVDVRGEDPGVWAHGVRFLARERLFDPPLPADAAALHAAASAAEKNADR